MEIITVTPRLIKDLIGPFDGRDVYGLDISNPIAGFDTYGEYFSLPTDDLEKADFIQVEDAGRTYLFSRSLNRGFDLPVGMTPATFVDRYLKAQYLETVDFEGPVNRNVLTVAGALGPGYEFEVSIDDFDYFQDALMPVHFGRIFRGRHYDFGFREGDDRITHFRLDKQTQQAFAVLGD